jgi:CHAT domain-containing protein
MRLNYKQFKLLFSILFFHAWLCFAAQPPQAPVNGKVSASYAAAKDAGKKLKSVGERCVEHGRLRDGIANFRQAQQAALVAGDWDVYSESIYAESDALTLSYQVQAAKKCIQEGKKVCKNAGKSAEIGLKRLEMYETHEMIGENNLQEGLARGEKLLEFWKQQAPKYAYELAFTHHMNGIAQAWSGDVQRGIDNLNTALLLLKDRSDLSWRRITQIYLVLSLLKNDQQQYAEAEALWQKGMDIVNGRFKGPHYTRAYLIYMRGIMDSRQGNMDAATKRFNRGLEELLPFEEVKWYYFPLYDALTLVYCDNPAKAAQAILYGKKQVALLTSAHGDAHAPPLGYAYQTLALSHATLHRYKEAHAIIGDAIQCLTPGWKPKNDFDLPDFTNFGGNRHLLISIIRDKGVYLEKIYGQNKNIRYLDAAYTAHEWTVREFDRMRKEIATEEDQMAFEGSLILGVEEFFEEVIKIGWQLYDLKKDERYLDNTLLYLEMCKAGLLSASLKKRNTLQFAGIPPEVLQQERDMSTRLGRSQLELWDFRSKAGALAPDDTMLLRLEKQHAEANATYQNFLKKIEREYPHYYQLQHVSEAPTAAEIQKYLKKHGATLLNFRLNSQEAALYIVRITPQERQFFRIGLDSVFFKDLEQLLGYASNSREISQRSNAPAYFHAFCATSHRVFRTILGPVLQPEDRRLVVIPDGFLHQLPIELLLESAVPQHAPVNYAQLPYLLRKRTVRQAFSTGLLLEPPSGTAPDQTLAGFAPAFQQDTLYYGDKAFGRLRHNDREAIAVAGIFAGRAFTGSEATKDNLRVAARDYRILHIASHALTDDKNPMLSFIALGDSTRLYFHEFYDWHIRSELTVLSACNTGSGLQAKGEGVMSLARAFRYAGCPNLLVSLWQVDDESTRIMIEHFYRRLKSGMAKDEALQQAKLDYLEARHKTHPYFWAPFVLLGDDAPMSDKSNLSFLWLAGALALLALAAGLYFKFRRKPE